MPAAQVPLALGVKIPNAVHGLGWGSQQTCELLWPKHGNNVSSYTKLVWTAQFQQQLGWANFPNAICMNIIDSKIKTEAEYEELLFHLDKNALEHNALTLRRVKQRLKVFSAMIWDKSQFTKHSSLGTSHPLHNW